MPVYKLHYFKNPRQGRAELSRLILSQAGVEFQDIRFSHCEWPAIKPSKFSATLILLYLCVVFWIFSTSPIDWLSSFIHIATPFGHVPILEVDGRVLAQSNTIARYLAKKHGLAGKDEWEQAQADMYADNIHDLLNGIL